MKRTIFLMFFIALLYSAFSSGQIYDASVAETMDYLRRDRLVYNSNEKAYENIDGTPYLEKEFETGKIYLKTGEVIKGDFRFDLYANHIQFINDDSRYVIAYPEKIARVELNGYIFEHIDYKIDAGVEHGYFIVLAEGYYSLYLRKSKTLKDPVSAKAYQQPRPARFLDHRENYYIKIGENPAQRVRNKRRLIKMFGDLGPEVEKYIKEEKIRVRRDYDLVKLITYINNELLE